MKLKLLLLLLLAVCTQIVAGSKKKNKNRRSRLFTLGMGLLVINSALADKMVTTNELVGKSIPVGNAMIVPGYSDTSYICPKILPPYALDMINYIRCGDKAQTADFYGKYLMEGADCDNLQAAKHENALVTIGDPHPSSDRCVTKRKCATILSLYKKVRNLGKCALGQLTSIANGAQQRILGKTLEPEKEQEMFEEYLSNIDGIKTENVESLAEAFEKLQRSDFFQVKRAGEFFKKYKEIEIDEALKESLKPDYQRLNFDQVEHMMPYSQILYQHHVWGTKAIKEALKPEYQKLDFDKVKRMMPYAQMIHYVWKPNQVRLALDAEYQKLDFDEVDYIHKLLKISYGIKDNKSEIHFGDYKYLAQQTLALPQTVKYDIARLQKVFEGLTQLFPNNSKFAATSALEPWIQNEHVEVEKISKALEDCKKSRNKEACWKLKAKKIKKTEFVISSDL